MAETRIMKTGFTDLYDLRIKRAWIEGFGTPEMEYDPYYNIETSDREDERGTYITGFGMWNRKEIGANVNYDNIYAGKNTTITHFTWASAYVIEQETVEDEPHGLLGQQLATSLADMGKYTVELLAAQQFNSGWTAGQPSPFISGTSQTEAFFGSHTIEAGGTYSNTPTVQCDFSVAALQSGLTNLEKTVTPRGTIYPMTAQEIVVPTSSRWLVQEILGSQQMPYTADNTPNVAVRGLSWKVWRFLTDDGRWFLHAGKAAPGQKGIHTVMFWRVKPEFDRDNVFDSGDRRYKGRMRLSFGRWDWRGWYGSSGAA